MSTTVNENYGALPKLLITKLKIPLSKDIADLDYFSGFFTKSLNIIDLKYQGK